MVLPLKYSTISQNWSLLLHAFLKPQSTSHPKVDKLPVFFDEKRQQILDHTPLIPSRKIVGLMLPIPSPQ